MFISNDSVNSEPLPVAIFCWPERFAGTLNPPAATAAIGHSTAPLMPEVKTPFQLPAIGRG